MSVLIYGMEMPKSCRECAIEQEGFWCGAMPIYSDTTCFDNERREDCPLVEIVHCKECVYMEHGVKDSDEIWCCWHDSRMMESDFCSRGIKEQGDGNETH